MSLAADFRFAVRSLRQSPGLVAVAALSLGLGIATNVTMFAAMDPIVFHPHDLPNGDRIVRVNMHSAKRPISWAFSPPDLRDLQRQARTVDLAGYEGASFNWSNGDPPDHLAGARATGTLFEISGIVPILGRSIRPEDEVSRRPVALISERLWRDRFARERTVLGRPMLLDGVEHTIIGVLPGERLFPFVTADVWTALPDSASVPRDARSIYAVGRLRPDQSLTEANAELGAIMAQLATAFPATNRDLGVSIATLEESLVPSSGRRAAVVLFAAVGFVLLIACANVANLLLTRGAGRAREVAVRAALGASRGRIIRQLLTESLLLAVAGGVLGIVLSVAGTAWARDLLDGPASRPGVPPVRLSGRAFGIALAATGAAALLFGLFPAIRASSPDLNRSLRDGDRGATGGAGHARIRTGLVVGELALALVLLISATLLIETTLRYSRMDLGFDPRNAISFRTVLTDRQFRDSTHRAAFIEQLEARLVAIPGVQAAGAGAEVPIFGGFDRSLSVVGEPEPQPNAPPVLRLDISPGYLAAAGMRVVRGRAFTPADRLGAQPVALVNETAARHHWAGRDPVGQRLRSGSTESVIVGVVNDVRVTGSLDDPPFDLAFFAAGQTGLASVTFIVRSALPLSALTPRIRTDIEALAPGQPIFRIQTLDETARITRHDYQVMTQLVVVLSAAALILAVIGVYGAMSNAVAQRASEIGIRRALGAQAGDVLRLLARHGGLMVGLGSLLGIPLAFGMARLVGSVLPGVRTFDGGVFASIPIALAITAALATLVPARRAIRVDALVALRNQ